MHTLKILPAIMVFFFSGLTAFAQPAIQTKINYTLRVNEADLSGYDIEIKITDAPTIFHLAMATHKEYDDQYWRYVQNFRIDGPGKNNFIKEDSALWKITAAGKLVTIQYRIQLPAPEPNQRGSWKPFLSPTGGLLGDLHSFMYLAEKIHTPSRVTFQLPAGWKIATGLQATNDPAIFYASSAKVLTDCPVLAGQLKTWNFSVKGIPHTIAYWPATASIDTSLLVNTVKKIAIQAADLFDTIPYKNYTFLFQDSSNAALEHGNSVTIGIPATTFQRDLADINHEIAHEYFHTWNLMHLRPAEYSEINYGPKEKAAGLWWSEGMSIFYSDLLLRRAKLPTYDSTRLLHLEKLIGRYFFNPAYQKISPEKASIESNEPAGAFGDYSPSVHLQGEITGAMLDLIIRNATNGKHSIDDVMRKIFYRFAGEKGFHAKDIEQAVKEICNCEIHSFFRDHIYNAKPVNFDQYLNFIGKKVHIVWKPAQDNNGRPLPDYRMYLASRTGENNFTIIITNPESCWAKAGLHTGDKVVTINNMPVTDIQSYRMLQRSLQVGDTVEFEISRNSQIKKVTVTVQGYNVPAATITSLEKITPKQKKLFADWSASK